MQKLNRTPLDHNRRNFFLRAIWPPIFLFLSWCSWVKRNSFCLFLESNYELIYISYFLQLLGFVALFYFIKKERDNLYNKHKLAKKEFLEKISGIATLSYRFDFPFCFFVIKANENEKDQQKIVSMYDSILDIVIKKTRGYHLCSNLYDHIAIFIPYIQDDRELNSNNNTKPSPHKKIEDLQKTIETHLKDSPKTKKLKIRTGFKISEFNQSIIKQNSIMKKKERSSSHINYLRDEIKQTYDIAFNRA